MKAILFAGALACMACTPSQRANVPVLSTVDAVGASVSRLLGWCEDHDVSLEDLDKARKALDEKRYAEAAALAAELVEKIGQDEEVPEEIAALAGLVRSLAEAHALDD
jgi:hypothetical protein